MIPFCVFVDSATSTCGPYFEKGSKLSLSVTELEFYAGVKGASILLEAKRTKAVSVEVLPKHLKTLRWNGARDVIS